MPAQYLYRERSFMKDLCILSGSGGSKIQFLSWFTCTWLLNTVYLSTQPAEPECLCGLAVISVWNFDFQVS
jgi:hypothetical protein